MQTFEELVESRRRWIADVLEPWCRTACRKDLLKAAMDWGDIAGRVDADATLWTWAWSRFPALVYEGLSGVNETQPVKVTLQSNDTFLGFPDARQTTNGQLTLVSLDGKETYGPISIDDIAQVERGSMDSA